MRHAVFGRRLGRDINARKALLSNLASALIVNGKVTTTLAKAKFTRPYVEKLVTAAKTKRLHLKRVLASQITREAFLRLTGEIAPGFATKSGGYTRIVRLNPRRGDSAPMAKLEFLEWDKSSAKSKSKKTKDNKNLTTSQSSKTSSAKLKNQKAQLQTKGILKTKNK